MNALIRHLVFEPVKTVYQDLRRMQMNRGRFLRISAIAGVLLFWSISALTAQVRHLKPAEAVHLAVEQNRTLKIARLKVQENEHRKEGARSAHFPTLTNQSNILHITDLENVLIPPGAFGTVVGVPIPARNTALSKGEETLYSSGTMLAQPLTQLLRIHEENRIAACSSPKSHPLQK